ncbi:MAG: hypothetical protein ACON4J_07330 [Parvibaculales bacterium]
MDRVKKAMIFGRGFGLYGHAVAMVDLGFEVFFPADYRPDVLEREEMAELWDKFHFIDDATSSMSGMDLVCCARRPAENAGLAEKLFETNFSGSLVVEKPIHVTPDTAMRLAEKLNASGLNWGVPYLFLYEDWFADLKEGISSNKKMVLNWSHQIFSTQATWKSNAHQGGGALAFYMIHILAVFQALGLTYRLRKNEKAGWTFESAELCVNFQLDEIANFEILENGKVKLSQAGPFGDMPRKGLRDPRATALQKFYQDLLTGQGTNKTLAFHQGIHERWQDAIPKV